MKRRTLLQVGAGSLLLAGQTGTSQVNAAASDRRQDLYELLGKLPPRNRKVSAQLVSTEDRGTYTLEKLVLDLNGEEAAPAYFAKTQGQDRQTAHGAVQSFARRRLPDRQDRVHRGA